jgi:hypothetical protein
LSEQNEIIPKIKEAFIQRGFDESQIKSMLDRNITGQQAYAYLGGIKGEKIASPDIPGAGAMTQCAPATAS